MIDSIDDVRSTQPEWGNTQSIEPPIVGTVPCIVCGHGIPINALQSFNVQRMCRACKQAVMSMTKLRSSDKG